MMFTMMTTAYVYMYILSLVSLTDFKGSDSAFAGHVTRGLTSTRFSSDDNAVVASVIPCSGSAVLFEQFAHSVIHCSLMCTQNRTCDGFYFTESRGACVGCLTRSVIMSLMVPQTGVAVFFQRG